MDEDLSVITHGGDLICPGDPAFGYLVCTDCSGTGLITDTDGSISGTTGSEIPCACSVLDRRSSAPLAVAA
ncbi:hypothetical protein GT028_08900 [Streptomyces sp. SID2999]|uniref:hypothetical protein n=1 Tax=Streptomyces sp. SID2999 TaxID=2690258 RepID=UPI001371BF1A|nr:hypothetical protein [Streptomyces sp. SID2999]MYZ07485.1 hypothetical protein [Streptomyces sp. SID2999]